MINFDSDTSPVSSGSAQKTGPTATQDRDQQCQFGFTWFDSAHWIYIAMTTRLRAVWVCL